MARAITSRWKAIPDHFPYVTLDAFVIMPNHLHGILLFTEPVGAGHARPLPVVIGSFKSATSRQVGSSIWQRSYWERVLRNEHELNTARHYIDDNPFHYSQDKEYLI
jgi:REP element-mobilizing transposase RayT